MRPRHGCDRRLHRGHPRTRATPDILFRTGFLCLRRIADLYSIAYDPDPSPGDPISVTRAEFDVLCVELQAAGVPLVPDLDQAWLDFAGWRVNYDRVLIQMCTLVMAPSATWSSDRAPATAMRPSLRRRQRGGSPADR